MKNRLADEQSLYLRMYADDPVHWQPWSNEAFSIARERDRPVFVSIGFSSCHECSLMEDESFSDSEVAMLLNESFINIKVDREERPDIDAVYMAACKLLNDGKGGWPLTVLLDHERRPFFAGSYFPRNSRQGQVGLMEMLPRIKYLWLNSRDKLIKSSEEITKVIGPPPELSSCAAGGDAPGGLA